ncbi:MAG: GRP family sugar transporter, partial [Kiritimatiellales bacterium]
FAWGSWLVPSQKVRSASQQIKTFYVALSTFIMAVAVVGIRGEWGLLTSLIAWIPLLGGLIWSLSAWCAFSACKHIGIAKAFGIWSPLNIVVSFIWSLTLFGQFRSSPFPVFLLAGQSILLITIGILMIICANSADIQQKSADVRSVKKGIAGAGAAGVLWGSYYIPSAWLSRCASGTIEISVWASTLPLAAGMLLGTLIFLLISRQTPKLQKTSDYACILSSGALWAVGNFCMLLTVQQIGPGPGYTIASLCIAVNTFWGIFYFKEPTPRSRAAWIMMLGILLTLLAGMVLGNLTAIEHMCGAG